MREAIKAFNKAVEANKVSDISEAQTKAVKAIDIAVKKNLIHKNKAARQKSALSAKAKASGVKIVKAPAKKAVAKPTAATATTKKTKSAPKTAVKKK
jgi:ribosomal protein S20